MINLPNHIIHVLSSLKASNYQAYLVGGCVRDYFLNRDIHDYDICTDATPEQVMAVFKDQTIIPTGLQHGTVTLVLNKEHIEITTFRIDSDYLDNRHPESVTFTKSLKEDLARRDFTINALALDSEGNLYDYFNGQEDLNNRLISCVNNPNTRFREDALRILRALRFSSVLSFTIQDKTKQAIFEDKDLLNNIAYERIKIEMDKLLCGANVEQVLTDYVDVIGVFIPELLPMVGFNQHNKHHIYDVYTHTLKVLLHTPQDPIFRWAALLHDIGKVDTFTLDETGGHFYDHELVSTDIARVILNRLKFDNTSKRRILNIIKYHMLQTTLSKKSIKRKLHKVGLDTLNDLILFKKADLIGKGFNYQDNLNELEQYQVLLEEIIQDQEAFSIKDLSINGHDLMNLNIQGKEIGYTLDKLLTLVINNDLPNDKDSLLNYVKSHL